MIVFDGIVYNLQETGGISTLFNELISRLPDESYILEGFQKQPPLNIPVNNYQFKKTRLLERYRSAKIENKCDVFHSTYYRLPSIKTCKTVTTVHDFIYERYSAKLRRAVHSFQKNIAITNSDRIICVSENTRQDLLKYVGPSLADRSVVIYNGVSDKYYPDNDIKTHYQVIFVGCRSGYKNFKSVVIALSTIPDLKLMCVGGGRLSRNEIKLLNNYIYGRYNHASYLTNEELNIEYNRSLCLAYPSLYEGFGIPIIEAMRAGCPVIAVNCSSIPEVAGDAAILLSEGRPEEIRAAIHLLMVTKNREEYTQKGLLQSLKFDWDITFKQTMAIYKNFLNY